jgi:hypothetical protein
MALPARALRSRCGSIMTSRRDHRPRLYFLFWIARSQPGAGDGDGGEPGTQPREQFLIVVVGRPARGDARVPTRGVAMHAPQGCPWLAPGLPASQAEKARLTVM